MKIHYFSGEPWEEAYVRGKLPDDTIEFHAGPIAAHPEVSDPEAQALCVFIESKIGEAELSRFPALKLIATRSTGYDHIDLAVTAARGITVAYVPDYGENTVAEFAFALILALSRRVIDARERVRTTGTFSQENLRGFDLAGKTLGVVGCGHIGVHVIRMGKGFGMKVLGFDVRRDDELAKALGFTYASLDELFVSSDVVTIHVPYNTHTHHLVSLENIGRFKKGSYLINTARGGVVETDAIIAGLKNGILAGAGLDVLEEEGALAEEEELLAAPHPQEKELKMTLENHYLISDPRVIVTPHIAFDTTEAVTRILDTTIGNVRAFASGAPANVVGPTAGAPKV